jgi:hypothetical protein
MTSISGASGADATPLALRIAEQNRLSTKKNQVSSSGEAGGANVLSKLNALYGSDGRNKATSSMDDVAGMLGVDSETLTRQLQGPNAGKVKELMQQAALLKTFQGLDDGSSASGSLFDTKA